MCREQAREGVMDDEEDEGAPSNDIHVLLRTAAVDMGEADASETRAAISRWESR